MYHLTTPQQNIWNLRRFYEGTSISNNCGAMFFDKKCDHKLLNSDQNLYFDRLVKILNALDIKMEVVDGNEFNKTLQQLSANAATEYIYEAFQNDMDEDGNLLYDSNIHIRNEFTIWFMKKLGFEWAKIDYDYVKGYVEYFRKIGYLEV